MKEGPKRVSRLLVSRLAPFSLALGLFAGCGGDEQPPASPADAGQIADDAAPDAGSTEDASGIDDGAPDGDTPGPSIPRYVYLSRAVGIAIGAITDPIKGTYRLIGEIPQNGRARLARAPTGKFLMAATEGALNLFAIDGASGFLSPMPSSPGDAIKLASTRTAIFSPDGATVFAGLKDNTIRAYRFNATTAELTQVGIPYITPPYPDGLAVTGDGKFLYALVGWNLYGYTVAKDGALSPLAGFPMDVGQSNGAQELRADPTGRFVALAFNGVEKVALYKVDPTTGALTSVPNSPYPALGNPWAGTFSKDGRRFYVACGTANLVRGIAIDPTTGALSDAPGSPYAVGKAPELIQFDDEETVGYVALGGGGGGVATVSVQPDGALLKRSESRTSDNLPEGVAVASGPKSVTFEPKYVYALGSASITAYTMDPVSGALTAVPSGTTSVDQPYQAVVDPRGKLLYAISPTTGLHTFEIGATGALTELGTAIAIASSPVALEISKTGRYLYVALSGGGQISIYPIDEQGKPSSVLAGIKSNPNGSPIDVRFDGVGRLLWTATTGSVAFFNRGPGSDQVFAGNSISTGNTSSPQLAGFSLDGNSAYFPLAGTNQIVAYGTNMDGAPTALGPYTAGNKPHSVAVDPSGRFVYVTDTGAAAGATTTHSVLAFLRAETGALTQIPGTFTSLERPYMATVDPSGKFLLVAATGTVSPVKPGGLSVFPIQADGTLGAATNTSGSAFGWVTVVPTWN